jgi:hypothetical protein
MLAVFYGNLPDNNPADQNSNNRDLAVLGILISTIIKIIKEYIYFKKDEYHIW